MPHAKSLQAQARTPFVTREVHVEAQTYISCKSSSIQPEWLRHTYHDLAAALLFLPGLLAGPPLPFILFAEKPLKSALLSAVPDFENLFFPPCPYLASFFCRLVLPVPSDPRSFRVLESLSTLISSNRLSPSVTRPVSLSLRSVVG